MDRKQSIIFMVLTCIVLLYGVVNILDYWISHSECNQPGGCAAYFKHEMNYYLPSLVQQRWIRTQQSFSLILYPLGFFYVSGAILGMIRKKPNLVLATGALLQVCLFVLLTIKGYIFWQDVLVPLMIGVVFFEVRTHLK